jgi:DNA-binding CsgD family transcriptional regulator
MHNALGARFSKPAVSSLQSWSSALGASLSNPFPFRELFEAFGNSPIGIAICDRRLRFVAVNRTLAEINKIPANEHLGRPVCDVVGNLGSTVETRLMKVFRTARPLHNAQLIGQLGANPKSGHWIENYFPIPAARNRVMLVGVFVLSISGLRLRKDLSVKASEQMSTSNLGYGPNGEQSHSQVLSPRQAELLCLLASGKSTKEAAASLGISSKTADTYRSKMMLKLHAHSVADLVHYAIRHQFVDLQG